MPRNPPPRQPQGPTLSPEQARVQLQDAVKKGRKLLEIQPLSEERYKVWKHNSLDTLKAVCGENSGIFTLSKDKPT